MISMPKYSGVVQAVILPQIAGCLTEVLFYDGVKYILVHFQLETYLLTVTFIYLL